MKGILLAAVLGLTSLPYADEQTIVLEENAAVTSVVLQDGENLDLNGFCLSLDSELTIKGSKPVSITNGTIISEGMQTLNISGNASVDLSGVTLINKNEDLNSNVVKINCSSSVAVNITDCALVTTGGYGITKKGQETLNISADVASEYGLYLTKGTTNINSSVATEGYAVQMSGSSVVNIEDGSYQSSLLEPISITKGTLTINHGTFLGKMGGQTELDKYLEGCRAVDKTSGTVLESHTLETIEGYEATCESEGLTEAMICEVCGATVLEAAILEPLGHQLDDEGQCERCDYSELRPESPLEEEQEEQQEPELDEEPEIEEEEPQEEEEQVEEEQEQTPQLALPESPAPEFTPLPPYSPPSIPQEPEEVEELPTIKVYPSDINDDWYSEAARFCVDEQIMSGYENGLFAPLASLTRGEVAQILWNMNERPEIDGSYFVDVQEDAFYKQSANWCKSTGIFEGFDDGTFRGQDRITREQICVVLWRYYGSPVAECSFDDFVDAESVSDWALQGVKWAVSQGIIKGRYENQVAPQGELTRGEMAVILWRMNGNG